MKSKLLDKVKENEKIEDLIKENEDVVKHKNPLIYIKFCEILWNKIASFDEVV